MIITKIVQEVIEKKDIVDIVCNKCEKSYLINNSNKMSNSIEIKYRGGYFSEYPGDNTEIKFTLCENCLKVIVDNLKHPPEIHGETELIYGMSEKEMEEFDKDCKNHFDKIHNT
jgi:uncharacterized CHY-type Zn-finger protein